MIEKLVTVRSVPCHNFTDREGMQRRVTAIIVPIRITRTADEAGTAVPTSVKVAYACSMGPFCYCGECRYSKGLAAEGLALEEDRQTRMVYSGAGRR